MSSHTGAVAFASPADVSGKKRRLPDTSGAAASSAAAGSGAGAHAHAGAAAAAALVPLSATFQLDERTRGMSVEEFLRDYLERAIGRANDAVDDAVDEVSLLNKQLREEIQNYRHQKRAEVAAKNKAGACRAAARE